MFQNKNWLDYIADVTAIGDFIMDAIEIQNLKKEQKKNTALILVTHLALSALAVGVSVYQTNNIKETIRKEVRH